MAEAAETKSPSQLHREKGNSFFTSASDHSVNRYIRICRLRDALTHYRLAKSSSESTIDSVSAAKNIGVAAKKIVTLINEDKEGNETCSINDDTTDLFHEAVENFEHACQYSSCKPGPWSDDLLSRYHQLVQDVISYYSASGTFSFVDMTKHLDTISRMVCHAPNLRCDLCLEIARLRFNEGVRHLSAKDYKSCLYEMKECFGPVEEARRYGKHLNNVMREVALLDEDIFIHECICRSHQARHEADELLEKYINDEESLNMDMVWTCVDLYREAIMLTKENDAEGEAIALSRMGSIYDKVIKGKVNQMRAKAHMMRSIQLAMSLHPKTFEDDEWFKDARKTLDRYQKELLQREQDSWQEDRAKYLEEISEDLKHIKEEEKKSAKDLLQYVYKTYPPKWRKDCKLPDPLPTDSVRSEVWKPIFKNAVIHYHPDKCDVEKDGKKWKVLCEEIFKTIIGYYEFFCEEIF